jgi:hypothetical protein
MNLMKKLPATAALLALGMSSAYAGPMVWTDTVTFTPAEHVSMFESVVYEHTLDDFNVGFDTINDYSISFNIFDDRDSHSEWVLISQTGSLFDRVFFNVSGAEFGGWNIW